VCELRDFGELSLKVTFVVISDKMCRAVPLHLQSLLELQLETAAYNRENIMTVGTHTDTTAFHCCIYCNCYVVLQAGVSCGSKRDAFGCEGRGESDDAG